ncbi:hypothetical protein NDI52_19455 [Leptolyngbya sp. PL-A3]|nr:hypothetical protein [Leptolyngbya sp. FACHB-16]
MADSSTKRCRVICRTIDIKLELAVEFCRRGDVLPEAALKGRVALVTGVSRRKGIGFAIAQQLAVLGADVFIHSFFTRFSVPADFCH